LGEAVLARVRRIEAEEDRAAAFDEQACHARTQVEKVPLVQQMEAAIFTAGFMSYLWERDQATFAEAGLCERPDVNLLGLIAMEARLHDPAIPVLIATAMQELYGDLQPEQLLPGRDDPDFGTDA